MEWLSVWKWIDSVRKRFGAKINNFIALIGTTLLTDWGHLLWIKSQWRELKRDPGLQRWKSLAPAFQTPEAFNRTWVRPSQSKTDLNRYRLISTLVITLERKHCCNWNKSSTRYCLSGKPIDWKDKRERSDYFVKKGGSWPKGVDYLNIWSLSNAGQPRSHGREFGNTAPQILLCPETFVSSI